MKITDKVTAVKLKKGENFVLPQGMCYTLLGGALSGNEDGSWTATEVSLLTVQPKNATMESKTVKGGEWATLPPCTFLALCCPAEALALATDGIASYILKDCCTGNFQTDFTVCVEPSAEYVTIIQFNNGGNK